MSTLVVVLRFVSLLAFAGPLSVRRVGGTRGARRRARRGASERAPLVANLAAFAAFLVSLFAFPSRVGGSRALLLASSGTLLAIAGAVIVLRSRAALGAAWSLLPNVDQGAGLVTSGPYRRVRHPIYLGLALLAAGEALAFGSWSALSIVAFGIMPTLAWRARTEEKLLSDAFGERYAQYRRRTGMIIPYVF